MRNLATMGMAMVMVVVGAACGESKEAPGGGAAPSAAPVAPAAGGAPIPQGSIPAELVGSWKRNLKTLDENANDALDAAEEKDVSIPMGYSALELAADGTCTLTRTDRAGTDTSFKGSCTAAELDGKPALQIEPGAESDEMPMTYRILSRTASELILKDPTGPQGAIYRYTR